MSVSEYTAMVSRDDRANVEFDQAFKEGVTAALCRIRGTEPYGHHDGHDDGLELNRPIEWGEVENGTAAVGHTVPLGQGLRQGCVLSPLLYCAFINTRTGEGAAEPVPPAVSGVASL